MALHLNEVVALLPEGDLIQVIGEDGRTLFPRDKFMQTPDVAWSLCPTRSVRDHWIEKETIRELCLPALYAGQRVHVIAPSPLMEDRILLRNFSQGLYRTIPLILLVAGVGGYLLSRRALRPIDLLIAEAKTINPDNLSRRLTVSLADDQLRRLAIEWNGLLARIDSAMSQVKQFTADASHELRTPVAYIRATAEYGLGNRALDAETREGLRAIVDEAKLMSDLLENLLTLARLDMMPTEQLSERTEVGEILAEVASYFRPMVQKKEQTLTVNPGNENHAEVRVNALHLRRILTVIVENAIKYTPAGGKITLGYNIRETVNLTVADSGIGIAPEHLAKIFDRFYRVDQIRSNVAEGVGLGLPIAKLITELYGGNIQVKSGLGHGTTFIVQFPCVI